jgi:hypothetical protein
LDLDFDEILNSNSNPNGFCPTNDEVTEITEVYREIDGQIRTTIQAFSGEIFLGVWFEMRRRRNSTKK